MPEDSAQDPITACALGRIEFGDLLKKLGKMGFTDNHIYSMVIDEERRLKPGLRRNT